MNYQKANEILTGRNKESKKIANNTYLERRPGDKIAIKLHDTDILTFLPDGKTVLSTGGWKTRTTKDRLNTYLPHGLSIHQEKSVWYIKGKVYQDGIIVGKRGGIHNSLPDKESEKTKKQVKAVKEYSDTFVNKVFNLEIPKPGAGDCWYCSMKTEVGEPLGEISGNQDHIVSHIEEDYFVPSLFYNAVKGKLGVLFVNMLYEIFEENKKPDGTLVEICKDECKRLLVRYLKNQLGIAQ